MIRRVKGTRDILPPESRLWAAVEERARKVFSGYGYEEIRLPVMESTELFVRGVGEGSDIVSKEMYTFPDRKGRSLTLRPEGTAGVARAFIENGMGQLPQPLRLFYMGPMFRYEKMQRGRYRQFSQIGIEILGAGTPEADVEVLLALHTFLEDLGFSDLVIVLNNLGDPEDRNAFIEGLKSELGPHRENLCADCRRRWDENPLRILDCKIGTCREIISTTTPVAERVSEEAETHVGRVEEGLDELGITVRRAPRLVRGLDYYLRTVFEVISPELGDHAVICGGGRYDRLISDLGGPVVPGIGFAIGEDRLVSVLPESFRREVLDQPLIAVLPLGERARIPALDITRELARNGFEARCEVTGRSMKASLKWAGKISAAAAVILGQEELDGDTVVLRDLRKGLQESLPRPHLVQALEELLKR